MFKLLPSVPKVLSNEIRTYLNNEEFRGIKISNRFRYFFCIMMLFVSILISGSNTNYLIVNLSIFLSYLAITVLQSIILAKGSKLKNNAFNYVMVLLDFGIFTVVSISYWQVYSPDNIAFLLKSPSLLLLTIPILLTLLQFHWRWIVLSGIIFFIIFISMVIYSFSYGIEITETWQGHILGPEILPNALMVFPFIILLIILIITYSVIRTSRLRQNIGGLEIQKTSLSRYFSPAIVDQITENPDSLNKGRRQEVSVLFSDIRGFTSLSENMDPVELAQLLTDYREVMVRQIFLNSGTVDKFIGDAIMATFGTPYVSEIPGADAENAYKCALGMMSALKQFNIDHGFSGELAWKFGIGLHSGEVFVGNIGKNTTLEYTVLGDAVNTASRIEQLCKKYQKNLLLSADIYSCLNDKSRLESLGELEIRGRKEKMKLYCLK